MSYGSNKGLEMYKSNGVTPDILEGLHRMIGTYADTSNKKVVRIQAMEDARIVLEHVCVILRAPEDPVSMMLFNGFNLLLMKVSRAIVNPDNLQDFKQELAFLAVLSAK